MNKVRKKPGGNVEQISVRSWAVRRPPHSAVPGSDVTSISPLASHPGNSSDRGQAVGLLPPTEEPPGFWSCAVTVGIWRVNQVWVQKKRVTAFHILRTIVLGSSLGGIINKGSFLFPEVSWSIFEDYWTNYLISMLPRVHIVLWSFIVLILLNELLNKSWFLKSSNKGQVQ